MTPGARYVMVVLLFLLSPVHRCQESQELVPGDVTLGAMFSINNIQGEDGCGDYDVDTVKEVMVVKWFLDTLNTMNYIPGVRMGLEAYRTCQSGERATRNAVFMLEKYRVLKEDTAQDINITTPLLGILGPGRTQEAIVVSRFLSSLPSSQRPLLISGSATGAALTDREMYSNFFRVIPPDSTQVQVLLRLLQTLGWNYISIVYDDDAYGREAAEQLRELAVRQDVCVPSFAPLPLDYRSAAFISAANAVIQRLRGGDSSIITGVVFIGSAHTASAFLALLAQTVTFVRFIFSEALGLQTSVLADSVVGRGALVAAPPYLPLPEFRPYWNRLWTDRDAFSQEMQKNSWLAGYYTSHTQCTISDVTCWTKTQSALPVINDDSQWLFEYYHVKAAAVFAAVLKTLHSNICGPNFNGTCLALKESIRNNRETIQGLVENNIIDLEEEFSGVSSIFSNDTEVKFNERGEVTAGATNDSQYNVFNYRECDNSNFCFQKVGTYRRVGNLDLDTEQLRGYTDSGGVLLWPNFTKSQCMADQDCLGCVPQHLAHDIVFVPGDVYIVAVAPVHNKVAGKPLQCGGIRTAAGADFVQAVLFAVQKVNEKRPPFDGIFGSSTLGVVIINSCSRELVVKEKLMALYKGNVLLPDGRNSSHIVPLIAGYVGAFFSTVSVAMYEVLANMDTRFVIVSPSNTSPELSDRVRYPLFLRLTSGEDSQVRALLTLVSHLGHRYVQVIYDPDDVYTLSLKESINTLSSSQSFNICVVNNIASDDEHTSFYPVLDDLRKNAWAPLVIVVLQVDHTHRLMTNILSQMAPNDHFRFLGTDAWARSSAMLKVPSASRLLGSLTFSVELPLSQLFQEYLRKTDPLKTTNPWLKYFWEERKQCYFDGSFQRKGKSGACPSDLTRDYLQNSWLPFYIDAVYTFALGLHSAMTTHCGQPLLCNTMTSERLAESIRKVRLDLFNTGVLVNVFDKNGDGDVGYKLFQIAYDVSTPSAQDITYVQVGRYERESLTLDRANLWILNNLENSVCPNPATCKACFPPLPVSSNISQQDSGMSGTLIGAIAVIAVLAIALIVVVILFIITYRRQRGNNKTGEKTALDEQSQINGPRPLPPIQGSSSTQEITLGSESRSGSGSGGTHVEVNDYDYLHMHGPNTSGRSSHAYAAPSHSGGSGGSSGRGGPVTLSLNSAGYVPRNDHPQYELARLTAAHAAGAGPHNGLAGDWPDVSRQMSRPENWPQDGRQLSHPRNWPQDGRQMSRPENWPQDGQQISLQDGRQMSHPENWPLDGQQMSRSENWPQDGRQMSRTENFLEGERQNSRLEIFQEGGQQHSRPENWDEGGRQTSHVEDMQDEGGRQNSHDSGMDSSSAPQPCGSAASSGYLTPLGEADDYLQPRMNILP